MSYTGYFTSESVSEGHPDKLADQVSDAILDAILTQDPHARVACETLIKSGMVMIAGEITTQSWADIELIARKTIKKIGYTSADVGFDAEACAVITAIGKQSPDIAQGVDRDQEIGAGDQGMMFGYANRETDVLMPAAITFAHRLMLQQAKLRKNGQLPWLRPDAKAQVTLYYENGQPRAVKTIVLSTQHDPDITQAMIKEAVIEEIIKPIIPSKWLARDSEFLINPTGRFVLGGPLGDCGLTGRKIIVDTYGGSAHHGGGCFSGKDPTKVDRSAAYLARYIAKNIVAAQLADQCEVQIAYAIGIADPISIAVETFGTAKIKESTIIELIRQHFNMRPKGIINTLNLLRPIYEKTAAYGHFGREEPEFTWEKTDKAQQLQQDAGIKTTMTAKT